MAPKFERDILSFVIFKFTLKKSFPDKRLGSVQLQDESLAKAKIKQFSSKEWRQHGHCYYEVISSVSLNKHWPYISH